MTVVVHWRYITKVKLIHLQTEKVFALKRHVHCKCWPSLWRLRHHMHYLKFSFKILSYCDYLHHGKICVCTNPPSLFRLATGCYSKYVSFLPCFHFYCKLQLFLSMLHFVIKPQPPALTNNKCAAQVSLKTLSKKSGFQPQPNSQKGKKEKKLLLLRPVILGLLLLFV